ncbi:hypothetical protein C8A01DRAFT_43186 [Parachaetomium inaequale]|uniref:LysM domain-containing protein n=1 Tax=Parachaetomium inaequale TaxID=2588326 RepID=A0AAN6PNF4_9PEZI|nr:hypothetical protein C8A01DRAFT_43186 [Parachaetomium inaequale]
MSQAACCTCASLLTAVPRVSSSSEKPLPDDRRLDCCGRTICGACIHRNTRFLSYCPYCQTSGQSPLSSRLKTRRRRSEEPEPESEPDSESDPPPYSAIAQTLNPTERPVPPPPYTPSPSLPPSAPQLPSNPKQQQQPPPEKQTEKQPAAGYTIHHLRHPPHPSPDTLLSLSLQYGIPLPILRQHNRLPNGADYLLAARNTLLIPTAYITTTTTTTTPNPNPSDDGGSASATSGISASLSPHPIASPAERERKIAVRRFMVACKESDYDTAVVYLEESGYSFAEAVQQYREDAEWEGAHPLMVHPPLGLGDNLKGKRRGGNNKGKGKFGRAGNNLKGLKTGDGGGRLLGWLKG